MLLRILDMDRVFKLGQTVHNTWANGIITRQTASENLFMLMVTPTKVTGKTIKRMVTERIVTRMVLATRATGLTICNTVMEKKNGQMAVPIKAGMLRA